MFNVSTLYPQSIKLLHQKKHDNLQKFPKATSLTSAVGLNKTLAVPVITLVLTAEWDTWWWCQTEKYKQMKKVNKQCLLDTPRTVRVSEKTWQVIVRTRRP